MRIIHLLIFILLWASPNAQTLTLEKEKLSAGDEKIDLQIIGNTSDYEIVCISTTGEVYTYNGRLFDKWSALPLKNTSFFESIYLSDTTLYVKIENNFFSFTRDKGFPIKVNAKEVKKKTPFSWEHPYPLYNNTFEIDRGNLLWNSAALSISTSIPIYNTKHLISSLWGKPYLLINNKLHSATPSPLSYEKDALFKNNQKPLKTFNTATSLHILYKSFIYIPQFSQSISLPQDILSYEKIKHILSPTLPHLNSNTHFSSTPIIIHTDEHLYIHLQNEWMKAPLEIDSDIIITSVISQDEYLLFTTKSNGIFQYKIPINKSSENPIIPHKLNQKLSEFSYINSFYLNKTAYFCTEEKGIFSINNKTLNIYNSPVHISQIIPFTDRAVVISEAGEFLEFNKELKFNKLLHHVPNTTKPDLLADGENIYYTYSDSLFTFNIKEKKITNSLAFQIMLKHAFYGKNRVNAFINNDLYSTHPKYRRNQSPILQNAYLKTSKGSEYEIFSSNKNLKLTSEDYPLTFWAEASFLENPSSVEYQYSWNDPKVKQRPFSFDNNYVLHTKLIGIAQPTITLKSGNKQHDVQLAKLETTRIEADVDYSLIIYMGLGLIAILLSIILFGIYRNRRQKKRIQQLQDRQKMMELEQKSLQMQMNPHFIFNSLNGVKGMIALGNTKNAKEYLTKISGWMRNMLNDSRSSQVPLSEEVKNLDLYLDIEQKLRGGNFSYSIENKVGDNSISIPSMMIQPFIENAIVHAFDGSQKNAHIDLIFERKGRKIEVKIEDNGKGIHKKSSSHKSVAMSLIRDRLELWNDQGNLYGVDVINKTEEKDGETGVRINLRLPIK